MAGIYALAFLWLLPKPWDGPLQTGAFLPLIVLAFGAVVWPFARRFALNGVEIKAAGNG